MRVAEAGKDAALRPRGGWVSTEQAAAIRLIAHFRDSAYQHLDLDLHALIDEYVQNASRRCWRRQVRHARSDIGAGDGWLASTFRRKA